MDTRALIEINTRLYSLERLVRSIVEPDKWLTIKDAVAYSSISESTLDRAVRKGTLKCSRQTGKRLFRRSAIDKWLENG